MVSLNWTHVYYVRSLDTVLQLLYDSHIQARYIDIIYLYIYRYFKIQREGENTVPISKQIDTVCIYFINHFLYEHPSHYLCSLGLFCWGGPTRRKHWDNGGCGGGFV